MAVAVQVTVDCTDPGRLAAFWSEALGYVVEPPPAPHTSWDTFLAELGVPEDEWGDGASVVDPDGDGPRLFFQRVPESKVVKNRLHLDLAVSGGRYVTAQERRRRVDAAVARLCGLGASLREIRAEHGGYTAQLADPEGNEFDLH